MSLNVIALGGNAILDKDPSDEGQKAVVAQAARYIADFVEKGEKVIVCHGNGPQVGNLLLQQKAGESEKNPQLKLDSCVAMTQGSIGYWLQNALINEFATRQAHPSVISLVTQVRVDPADPSFEKPSKPVGPFYSEEEANAAMAANGGVYQEDAGRGFRKVVPSPKPQEIVEKEAIKTLVDAGVITICAGGGGVPVVRNDNGFYWRGSRQRQRLYRQCLSKRCAGRSPDYFDRCRQYLHQLQPAESASLRGNQCGTSQGLHRGRPFYSGQYVAKNRSCD